MFFYQRSTMNNSAERHRDGDTVRRRWLWFVTTMCCLLLILSLGSPSEASSAELSAVTLLYFRGTGQDNVVLLEWATGTEFNTAGFRLTRSSEQSGQYADLDQIGFVPADGDGLVGADYSVVDSDNVVNGAVYWYELIEIELDGNENVAGPISVTAGFIPATATNTPEPTPTEADPGGSVTVTATPDDAPGEMTATSTPISQSSPQATSTPGGQSPGTTPIPSVTGSPPQSTPTSDSAQNNTSPSNTASAADPEKTLDASGYPAPILPDADESPRELRSVGEGGYPSPEMATPTIVPASYPLGFGDRLPNLTPPVDLAPSGESEVIGNQGPSLNGETGAQGDASRSGTSTFMLWIGFFAALLVFIAGVIGSIVYFSRQRMQGR
jgi:hypothetical protein